MQLDAAEEAALRAIDLLSDKGNQFEVCDFHYHLGNICCSRGETEKAINRFEKGLGIASTFNWHGRLSGINYSMAELFLGENRFDDAHAHAERAKSHATNSPYHLGRGMEMQARIWYEEGRLEEAKSEALRAASGFEKMGAVKEVEICRSILRDIEQKMKDPVTSGKFLEMVLPPTPVNSPFLAQGTE